MEAQETFLRINGKLMESAAGVLRFQTAILDAWMRGERWLLLKNRHPPAPLAPEEPTPPTPLPEGRGEKEELSGIAPAAQRPPVSDSPSSCRDGGVGGVGPTGCRERRRRPKQFPPRGSPTSSAARRSPRGQGGGRARPAIRRSGCVPHARALAGWSAPARGSHRADRGRTEVDGERARRHGTYGA